MMNRICELREEKKWTQTCLSMELELAQETMSGYERNTEYPGKEKVLAFLEGHAGLIENADYNKGA